MLLGAFGLAIGVNACTDSTPTPRSSPTPSVSSILPTRLAALAQGVLADDGGCLRVGDKLLVFPPDQYEVVREGEIVLVRDLLIGDSEPTVWHVGTNVTVGGGTVPDGRSIPHEPLPEHCDGPYWLVGGIGAELG